MKNIKEVLDDMNITMETHFVPFPISRNKNEKYPSLNWMVTILCNGKKVLTTDYMAGSAYCPSYTQKQTYESKILVSEECKTGYRCFIRSSSDFIHQNKRFPILPKIEDVMQSLVMDAEAFEYTFEDWCGSFGYEEDSRKAEKIYNTCVENARQLIIKIGTDGLKKLQEAYQDY